MLPVEPLEDELGHLPAPLRRLQDVSIGVDLVGVDVVQGDPALLVPGKAFEGRLRDVGDLIAARGEGQGILVDVPLRREAVRHAQAPALLDDVAVAPEGVAAAVDAL